MDTEHFARLIEATVQCALEITSLGPPLHVEALCQPVPSASTTMSAALNCYRLMMLGLKRDVRPDARPSYTHVTPLPLLHINLHSYSP